MRFPSATTFSFPAALAWALAAGALSIGCEGSPARVRDASPPLSERVAEVSIRLDLQSSGASVSVLAFRADIAGLAASGDLPKVLPAIGDDSVAQVVAEDGTVRVGDTLGPYTVRQIARGRVTFATAAGGRLVVEAPSSQQAR